MPEQIDTEPLSHEEIRRIDGQLRGHWRTFYSVLFVTGIRIGELLNVRRRDLVKSDDGQVVALKIDRLKKRDRTDLDDVPVPDQLGSELDELTPARAMAFTFHKRSRTGRSLNPLEQVTARAARKALAVAAQAAAVRLDAESGATTVHPHLYRHAFGRSLARKFAATGMNDAEARSRIQRMLGHSNFSTSAIYLKPSASEIESEWREIQLELLSSNS